MKRSEFLADVRSVVWKLVHDLAELLSHRPADPADGYKREHDHNERGDEAPEMHALKQFRDGGKDKGNKDGEGKGNQDDASEIERAHDRNGDDYSEKARKIFVSGVLGHYGRLFSRQDNREESVSDLSV